MTQEDPIRPKEDYKAHKPSEEHGLLEEFDEDHDPQYLLENDSVPEEQLLQLDFGYFQYQTSIEEYS